MSANNEKKKGAGKAHAVAAWEWFKSAAWLQVLLIVGVVVGIIVAIPFIVQGIVNASNKTTTSEFYSNHEITYSQFEKYLTGDDTSCNGIIGKDDNSLQGDENKEGFVVMFYKSNCSTCDTLQPYLEKWYDQTNKDSNINGNLKFYTIDVSWVKGDKDATESKEKNNADYKNDSITLQQEFDVQQAVVDVYTSEKAANPAYDNTSVTEVTLNTRLDGLTDGGTIPTPCFITFTKNKTDSNYITDLEGFNKAKEGNSYVNPVTYTTPAKVIFANIGSLNLGSAGDVATQMQDIYYFATYTKQS